MAFISSIVIGALPPTWEWRRGSWYAQSQFRIYFKYKKKDSLCRMWLFLSHPSQRKSAVLNLEGKK
jgi:hypothetical protein